MGIIDKFIFKRKPATPVIQSATRPSVAKKHRTRRVFGRVKSEGVRYEMTKTGILVREKRRKPRLVTFSQVLDLTRDQLPLAIPPRQ